MNRQFLLYAFALAALALALRLVEYRFLILEHSFEIYGGIIAAMFTVLGIYAGRKLTGKKEVVVEREVFVEVPVPALAATAFVQNSEAAEQLGLSKRELEILELMSEGWSNQEIAEKTYLSVHTIKSHASSIFFKLDVKRRTQAVAKAKELGLVK